MGEWIDALNAYLSEARKGWHDLSLKPAGFKSAEYLGGRAV